MPSEFANKDIKITEKLRAELKKPLGIVTKGAEEVTSLIQKRGAKKTIFVGDSVTRGLIDKVDPDVVIIDNKIMRKPIEPISVDAQKTIHVKNPRGHITANAWKAISMTMVSNSRVKIVVKGEEDLLTLPAIELAPEGSVVIYGQPNQGIIVNFVDGSMKEKVRRILQSMVSVG